MKSKLGIFLLLALFWLMPAAEAAGDGVGFSFYCKSATVVRFRISSPAEVTYLILYADTYPSLPPQFLVWPDGIRAIASEVPRGTRNLLVSSIAGSQDYQYAVPVPNANSIPDCGETHNPFPVLTEEGLECLAVPYPGAGYFTVDGNDYYYHNALSFIVPLDAIWRWELYIEGQLILVFEQTEYGNCHITEDYRQ